MTPPQRIPIRLACPRLSPCPGGSGACSRYDIWIGAGHLGRLSGLLRGLGLGTDAVVLSHRTILRRHGSKIRSVLARAGLRVHFVTVPDTERSKSLRGLGKVLLGLADLDRPGRRLFLVLAGGGVVGDLGGVAAGLYRRGIPAVQLPTTLLAQVDSSIGGKTGVDLPQGKNLAGLIVQPRLVFIELDFLRTLSDRQLRSGLAEVIKSAIIGDRALFEVLERSTVDGLRRDIPRLAWVIGRTVRVKAKFVEADETEAAGVRTILNLGHTFGHAVEAAAGYSRRYTHGEAVALGVRVAAAISRRMGVLPARTEERIVQLLGRFGLPGRLGELSLPRVAKAMAHDKKWAHGRNRWVLPTGIGRCVVREGVPEGVVRSAMESVSSLRTC